MVTTYFRGNKCKPNDPVSDKRACARCGRMPTSEGYDACLGFLSGINTEFGFEPVQSACCGHGVYDGFVVVKSGEYSLGCTNNAQFDERTDTIP